MSFLLSCLSMTEFFPKLITSLSIQRRVCISLFSSSTPAAAAVVEKFLPILGIILPNDLREASLMAPFLSLTIQTIQSRNIAPICEWHFCFLGLLGGGIFR